MATPKHILVVEGDPDGRARIAESLANPLLHVVCAEGGREALEYARREKPDVVVTELMLPDLSGLGLVRLLREDPALAHVGIVMVTDHVHEMDRVLAFECGVDDFLGKPFFGRELASRVAAVLRRTSAPRERAPGFEVPARGLVTLHPGTGSVHVGERRLELTPRELHLLATLMRHSGRVLTRRQLIARVWGDESGHTDRVVDAHIKSIRRKLGEAKDCVETVRGVGYRFSELGPLDVGEPGAGDTDEPA